MDGKELTLRLRAAAIGYGEEWPRVRRWVELGARLAGKDGRDELAPAWIRKARANLAAERKARKRDKDRAAQMAGPPSPLKPHHGR